MPPTPMTRWRTTTTSSTTTTTIPPTTTTSTTSLPTTTTTVVDTCARLRAQRAAVNAQITATENGLLSANLTQEQLAAAIARLEAIRAQANATFDAALAKEGCP